MANNSRSKFLDVEDDEQRQNRIGALLGRLNTTAQPAPTVSPNPLLQECPPGPVEPPAALLARVKTFLPAIAVSNQALSRLRPEDIDIERIPDGEERYIEMNLGLGVLEAKPSRSGARSTSPSSDDDNNTESSSTSGSGSSRDASEEESESDSSSSDDNDDTDSASLSESSVNARPTFPRPIKPLPRRVLGVRP